MPKLQKKTLVQLHGLEIMTFRNSDSKYSTNFWTSKKINRRFSPVGSRPSSCSVHHCTDTLYISDDTAINKFIYCSYNPHTLERLSCLLYAELFLQKIKGTIPTAISVPKYLKCFIMFHFIKNICQTVCKVKQCPKLYGSSVEWWKGHCTGLSFTATPHRTSSS